MSANNPPPQFSSHSKGQNSLNRTGTTHSKGQNSLNPQAEFTPRRDTAAPAGEKSGTPRKPFPLTAVLLLVIVLMAGALVYLYRNPRENAPDQTQPPVQTQTVQTTVQTQPPVQTETLQPPPPTETEAPNPPEPVIVKTPLVALRPTPSGDSVVYIHAPDSDAVDFYDPSRVINKIVADYYGSRYAFSIHADGSGPVERSLSFRLDGQYTRFSGWVVFLTLAENIKENKPVEIWCDGVRKAHYVMSSDSEPVFFDMDVTGVMELEIRYPESLGGNDQAAICDAWLESYENP